MSLFNASSNHNSSSSSSTLLPSETDLKDVSMLVSGAKSAHNLVQGHGNQVEHENAVVHGYQQSNYLNEGVIHTDYESSAAEDYETYPSSKYENAEYALLSYSRTNKLEKLHSLLEAKFKGELNLDLNYKGQQKQNFSWTALHLACYFGHIKVVELILSKKQHKSEVDINIQNLSGDTPLHKATLTNRAQIVQLLLSNGANVFIRNCDGLLAKQLTNDRYILNMLEASEQVDKNRIKQEMFKAVDNGDLAKVQEFFEDYDSCIESTRAVTSDGDSRGPADGGDDHPHPKHESSQRRESISQVIDERGNTLLHVAAMRGFKAICVFLLERGLDPYNKNNLGQTCIDLASYQLRQLFSTVKPGKNQIQKLSSQRVSRFEGPLLRKVRILGWRQIYIVLENGVILLFNNRRDSMNKSRRGYKYLESATCEPEPNDLGTFTICFSDKSRATFLVTPDHLNNYPSYKSSELEKSNQVELLRQKWIDTIRDHIKYSTDFIRNGLKLNEYDDDGDNYGHGEDLSTLNHLLPIDTIKTFVQEARAHYSILERHADSLCNLVQSTITANRLSQSFESSREESREIQITEQQPTATPGPAGGGTSRLFGLIRNPSRSVRNNSASEETNSQNQQTLAGRKRNNSLTNEFIEDNWHCILFHLRLLLESSQNTKVSMNQALTLMEHQEQLRQNRIQDQDERCRVLEDSLHALARDHHELEKSMSISQIYHSAAARSMSMSTDLNEYFDAFEDFDDEKTMTPTSMPSDEDLNRKIQEIMDEDERTSTMPIMKIFRGELGKQTERGSTDDDDEEAEEEDDARSGCSALTVQTVSEELLSATSNGKQLVTEAANEIVNQGSELEIKHRTRLPSPMVPRDQVSIWSILKNCIGKELSKITMPVVFNEPLTMLQRACECVQYTRYLKMADESDDPVERMEYICAFIVAGLSGNCHRIIKPFNPLLYETYEFEHELEDSSIVRTISQQVSHHPPITAVHAESDSFFYEGSVNPKIKFWGRSIEVQPDGQCRIFLKRHKETYTFKTVSCTIHNIIVGKLWFEHSGPLDIKCKETNIQANLSFKQAGWFSNDLHRFDGVIVSGDGKNSERRKLRFVYGKWSDYMKSVDHSDYETYMKENQQKLFRIPDEPDQGHSNGLSSKMGSLNLSNAGGSMNNNSVSGGFASSSVGEPKSVSKEGDKKGGCTKSVSIHSLDIPNSRTIWRLEAQYLEEYYNFTLFTMKLNELTPELTAKLPRTDSRFRLDVRKLEEGDLDGAAQEKQRLEEKQRAARARDKRFKDPSPDLLWFDLTTVPSSKEKFWVFKGGYWESKCNPENFPDLYSSS